MDVTPTNTLFQTIRDDIVIVNDIIFPKLKSYFKKDNIRTKVYNVDNKDITVDFSNLEQYKWYHPVTHLGDSCLALMNPYYEK